MIIINKPQVIVEGDFARLESEIEIDGKKEKFWFKTAKNKAKYLCTEKADAFLVGLLFYAMIENQDIKITRVPVSQRIIYGITHYLIPALVR